MNERHEGKHLRRQEAKKRWKTILAVFLSVVLVMQSSNIQAFADVLASGGSEGRDEVVMDPAAEGTGTQGEVTAPEETDTADEQASSQDDAEQTVAETEENPVETTAQDTEATTPDGQSDQAQSEQAPAEETDTTVTLNVEVSAATLKYSAQDGTEKSVTSETDPESVDVSNTLDFTFTVAPDDGQQVSSVAYAGTELTANDSGKYTIAAADLTDGEKIVVTTEAVPTEEPAEDATPVEPEETTESSEDEAATPEDAVETEAPAANNGISLMAVSGTGNKNNPYLLTVGEDSQKITSGYEGNYEWYIRKGDSGRWTEIRSSGEALTGVRADDVSNGTNGILGLGREDAHITISFTDEVDETATYQVVYARDSNRINSNSIRYFKPVQSNSWTVSFEANGGWNEPSPIKAEKGEPIVIPERQPSRNNGYTFVGWSTDGDATTAQYQPGDTIEFDKNTTLYAVWQQVYTVTFDPNGGSGNNVEWEITGDSFTTPSPESLGFSNGDKVFIGWSTNQNGNGDIYRENVTYPDNPTHDAALSEDVTLYAIWYDGESSDDDILTAYFYIRTDGQKPFEPSGYNGGYLPENNGTQLRGRLHQAVAINNNSELVQRNLADTPSDSEIQDQIEQYNWSHWNDQIR